MIIIDNIETFSVLRSSLKLTCSTKYYQNLPFVRFVPLPPYQCFHVHPAWSMSICAQLRSNRSMRFDCRRRSLEMKVLTMSLFVLGYLTVRIIQTVQ